MVWCINLSLFLCRLLPTSILTLLRVSCEMFILFWIGRTVAYRGKRSSTLTFLCVVITEQTARLLAGLYSLALFLSFFSLSLYFYRLFFVEEKYLHFSVAFPLVCSLVFLFVKSIKAFWVLHSTCDFQQLEGVFQVQYKLSCIHSIVGIVSITLENNFNSSFSFRAHIKKEITMSGKIAGNIDTQTERSTDCSQKKLLTL